MIRNHALCEAVWLLALQGAIRFWWQGVRASHRLTHEKCSASQAICTLVLPGTNMVMLHGMRHRTSQSQVMSCLRPFAAWAENMRGSRVSQLHKGLFMRRACESFQGESELLQVCCSYW